jgi:hypothetical protein
MCLEDVAGEIQTSQGKIAAASAHRPDRSLSLSYSLGDDDRYLSCYSFGKWLSALRRWR